MNTAQLVEAAESAAAPYEFALSAEVVRLIKLGHVAQWLANQDDSIDGHTLALRAQEAVRIINAN